MEHLLNCLYSLTELETERELTQSEKYFYIYCYNTLTENDVEITFGVNI